MRSRRGAAPAVAIGVAIWLAGPAAWGHTFPPVRSVVVQVEPCELVLMVGYRPASGESTDTLLARIASQPKSQRLQAAKDALATQAMQPLTVALDGRPLVPTSVRAKIGVDPGGTRPMVVVLVTYGLGGQGALSITSRDARSTRISWTDRASGRVDLDHAPGQAKWFTGVASFLLSVSLPTGASCVTSSSSP